MIIHFNIPNEFKCPISNELMVNPVKTNCSHTFEESALENLQNEICPICKTAITKTTPDIILAGRIKSYLIVNDCFANLYGLRRNSSIKSVIFTPF